MALDFTEIDAITEEYNRQWAERMLKWFSEHAGHSARDCDDCLLLLVKSNSDL